MPAWFLVSVVCVGAWGLWGFLGKIVSRHLNPWSLAVHQLAVYTVAGILMFAFLNPRMETNSVGTPLALVAGVFGAIGFTTFITALSLGNASIVVPMTSLYPLVTILLSFLFLGEPLTLNHGLGIAAALVAIILFTL